MKDSGDIENKIILKNDDLKLVANCFKFTLLTDGQASLNECREERSGHRIVNI